jgi:hypothetical protein
MESLSMTAMVRPFHAQPVEHRPSSGRLAGTVLVGALHVLIIAGLLQATLISMPRQRFKREIEIWFLFPPKPKQTERINPATRQSAPARPQVIPDYRHIALPPPAAETNSQSGILSFGCGTEQQAVMTSEERARCSRENLLRRNDGVVDYADHLNLSASAALWEQRRRRRNAPLLLPCADPHATNHTLHLDLICVGHALFEGMDADAQPGYGVDK